MRACLLAIVFRSIKFKGAAAMYPPGFVAIILAAGEGSRLNSARPKVLHEIAGQAMIRHVTAALRPLEPAETVVVIGRNMEAVARAVEPKDADPDELAIGLCNGGIMAIDARRAFDLLDSIGNDNAKREFYLTDIVGIANRRGLACRVIEAPEEDVLGVNTRTELAAAEAVMQNRLRR